MADEELRILAPRASAARIVQALSRRRFLGLGAAAGASALLAACGSSKKATTGASGSPSTETIVATGKGKGFNLYTWAEYDDPKMMGSYGKINIDLYASNEEAIQKLATAGGNAGYDMLVPTGVYIPQLVSKGLLEELNLDKIPNFKNLDPAYTNQPWDPGNKHSFCKDWGTTGWMYDKKRVTTNITTWADFIKVAQTEASGQTSVLDTQVDLTGIFFWANDISWITEKKEDLDACEKFIVNDFAKHIKSFESYPGIKLTQGDFALSQAWNGDARQGLIKIAEAGKDPTQYAWGIGAPKTELWMDNWAILKGAKHMDAAYAFMNFILDPNNSVQDLEFHGYNTGLKGIRDLVPKDLKYPEIIFFDDAQVKDMDAGAVNSAQDRLADIYNKAKAAASGG